VLKNFKFVLSMFLLVASAAQAELVIDVQGVAKPAPVAIVPFGWEGDAPSRMT
jgi:Tol biopolymer transport system component